MKEKRIQVKPFKMLSVFSVQGNQQVNEHGSFTISGLIDSDKRDEYLMKAAEETWVKVVAYDEKDVETTLFHGILTNIKITVEGDSCVMELELYSGTRLMDYETHIRTYQKSGYTYDQITAMCNLGYHQSDVIHTEGNGAAIPGFMMQYGETDWNFLKRIASTLNTVLIPESRLEGVKYFFGIPKKGVEAIEVENFVICQEQALSAKKKVYLAKSYVVESRSILSLGSPVDFQGTRLWIWRIETGWKGNELYHKYHLKGMDAFYAFRNYNQSLIGLSLLGTVKAVKGEQVQIRITDDENQESGECWFDYSTVYSSPDGAGWYCMPEIGDCVRLYCPSEDETKAYVTSAVHENNGKGIRTNPAHKIWRNKQGKEIRMTPDKVLLTNNDGMMVELIDGKGIRIKSSGSINIKAANNINLRSNASVEMAASQKITLKQGDTVMQLSDGIKLSGAKINLQ